MIWEMETVCYGIMKLYYGELKQDVIDGNLMSWGEGLDFMGIGRLLSGGDEAGRLANGKQDVMTNGRCTKWETESGYHGVEAVS
jgi:hypothetical protein